MAHNERNAVPPNYDKNPGGNGDDINATCNCGGCCCDCVPKYVIITEHNIAQEIEEGDHLAYTMEMCCIPYWHEVIVCGWNWTEGYLEVYERVRVPERGFRQDKLLLTDLWKAKLCRKICHDKSNSFGTIERRAEKIFQDEEEVDQKRKYNLWRNNCEHTARSLKTGKKESKQVKSCCCRWIPRCTCSICGKVIRFGISKLLRSIFLVGFTELADNSCKWLEKIVHVTCPEKIETTVDFFTIVFELFSVIVFHLIYWIICIIVLKCQENKKRITGDNYKDERRILRWDVAGSFVGAVIGVLVAIPLKFTGWHWLILFLCESVIVSLLGSYLSAVGSNLAFSGIRKRHEKKHEKNKHTEPDKPNQILRVNWITIC